jgi:hypothetical protein
MRMRAPERPHALPTCLCALLYPEMAGTRFDQVMERFGVHVVSSDLCPCMQNDMRCQRLYYEVLQNLRPRSLL